MGTAFVVDVGALAVAVEDHDEFGGFVDGCEGVRRHGGELGGLSRFDGDLAVTERQAHSSLDDEEPIVTRVYPLLRRLETQGLLLSEWREENKRNKRFYRLSSQGELILQKLLDELKTINASLDRILQEA